MTTEVIEVLVNPSRVVEVIERGPAGPTGASFYIPFAKPGILTAPYTSPMVFPVPFDSVLTSVIVHVNTAPDGADLKLDILKNGVSIYSSGGNPTITDGQNDGTGSTGSPTQATFVMGDLISVQITQVGSVVPGANVVMVISLERA